MTGTIIKYNQERKYGFISYQGGEAFFYITSFVSSTVVPYEGMDVFFECSRTDKGIVAINISVANNNKLTNFIKLGNDRIKLHCIKSYGIKDDSDEIFDEYNDLQKRRKFFSKSISKDRDEFLMEFDKELLEEINDKIYEYESNSIYKKAKLHGYVNCLYIETYQGDEYYYYQDTCGFDIYQKLEEIDMYLCQ